MALREQFQQDQADAERRQEQSVERRQMVGFQKQIEIYESLNPKVALDHLLSITDPDEAAKILLAMNTRKAKKIVEAGKRDPQLTRMKEILRRLRDAAPERSAELEAQGP